MTKAPIWGYLSLSIISKLGDSLLLFFAVALFLDDSSGILLSGILFSTDAILQIGLAPFLGKYIDRIINIKDRIFYALCIEFILMGLTILPILISYLPRHLFYGLFLALMIVMRTLSLITRQLTTIIPIFLDRNNFFPLPRALAFSNAANRGVNMVSASVAALLLTSGWSVVCIVNSITYLISLLGLFLLLSFMKKITSMQQVSVDVFQNNANQRIIDLKDDHWLKWNNQFLFLTNLAFGAVAFILMQSLAASKHLSGITRILSGPSSIYFGFLLALTAITLFPNAFQVYFRSIHKLILLLVALSLTLILAGGTSRDSFIALMIIIGILYGVSLIMFSNKIQSQFSQDRFTYSISKGQAYGRVGYILSMVIFTVLMKADPAIGKLIGLSGIVGLASTLLLWSTAKRYSLISDKL